MNIIKRALINIAIAINIVMLAIMISMVMMDYMIKSNGTYNLAELVDIKAVGWLAVISVLINVIILTAVDHCNDESSKAVASKIKLEVANKGKATDSKGEEKEDKKTSKPGIKQYESNNYSRQVLNKNTYDSMLSSQLEMVRKERLNK